MTQDRQLQVLRLAAALSFVLVLVNHLLPPKAFSATQLLFDYEFGLTRRGLVGEVLGFVTGTTVGLSEIYIAAALVSLSGAFGFYLFLSRQLPAQVSSLLLLILGLNSFAFSSFVGNAGYLDAILLMLAVVAMGLDGRTTTGLLLRLTVVVLGVLIHENMLPYFTILIGFDLWLARRDTGFSWLVSLAPALIGFALVGVLAGVTELSPEQAGQYAQHLQSKAEFKLDATSTDVAGRTIGQNLLLMSELRGTTKYWAWVLFDGMPLLAMSVWLAWLGWQVLGRADRLTRIFMLGAILAPLSLNFMAFDVVRFGAALVLCGFFALVWLMRYVSGAAQRLEETLNWPVFVVVLVLNANIFTLEVNSAAGHTSQFPWVLLDQLNWLAR